MHRGVRDRDGDGRRLGAHLGPPSECHDRAREHEHRGGTGEQRSGCTESGQVCTRGTHLRCVSDVPGRIFSPASTAAGHPGGPQCKNALHLVCQHSDTMAKKTSFGRDTGLQARMLLTMFLLGLVYAVLIGVLIAAGAGAVTIAIIAALLFGVQLFTSDKIALFSMGAREVSPQEAPELHAIVERLCVQANLPKPRVAIAETAMPNAFAVGRSPKSATVCATTALLNLLSAGE